MFNEENIHALSVEDLLGLLNSPQKEIVNVVRTLIKEQFSAVSDRCLVGGFMDYYFQTNSKHILDLLLGAPEPHSKFLLEKISVGLRSGERFRYLSVLLYAISRNSPPIWMHKLPNTILKDVLEILTPSKDSDLNCLVSGVMILVLLLPVLPYEFNKHLPKIFDCFWKLVHWTPSREQDVVLKPYLQVAVYSLFHRLYALYPCNLLSFLSANTVGQSNKSWFVCTLKPMLERVRLHPILIYETKETEVHKSRWVGLEPNDLIHECAKLCLDPLNEICEDMHLTYPSGNFNTCEIVPETSDYISLCSSENSFWSPGVTQSPSTSNTSVPHTPVYALQMKGNQSVSVVESPPEAAVEATPETTPFTSPNPYTLSKQEKSVTSSQILNKFKIATSSEGPQENFLELNPLSPTRKDCIQPKFTKYNQDIFSKSGKSDVLHMKLQEIQIQRTTRQNEGDLEYSKQLINVSKKVINSSEQGGVLERRPVDSKLENCSSYKESLRKRKLPIFTNKDLENLETDIFCEEKAKEEKNDDDSELERYCISEGDSTNVESIRKNSEEYEAINYEGLGIPSKHSMTELVKNVKTNRLRFLSQCGPPPNLTILNEFQNSIKYPRRFNQFINRKSWSSPDLHSEHTCLFLTGNSKRDHTVSLSTLSPVKPLVEMSEAATQTEEIPVVDPYEQLLEISVKTLNENKKYSTEDKSRCSKSPYEHLDQLFEFWCKDSVPEPGINFSNGGLSDAARNRLRAIQCERMFERYKREVHAERNRRLLGKVKKLHLLQEKDLGMCKEIIEMNEEIELMHSSLTSLQKEKNTLERKLSDMVEKQILYEVQEKQHNAFRQRDHLKMMCDTLQKEKSVLTKEIEDLKSVFREVERQNKVHMRHSTENSTLRKQVENLNKKLLIMGEIQLEMHQQMKNYKESQRHYRNYFLAQEKSLYLQRIQELECKNKTEKLSLEAAMSHIRELEQKLASGKKESLNLREEIETIVASWKERCDALEKRNKELNSVNVTLENRILQFTSSDFVRGSTSHNDDLRTCKDGFISCINSQNCSPLLEPSPDSYIERMTSNEFKHVYQLE